MASNAQAIKLVQEKLAAYLPRFAQLLVFALFLFLVFIPQGIGLYDLNSRLNQKKGSIVLSERGYYDATQLKKDLAVLGEEADKLDKRFPSLLETNMLIDSLKTITKEARLKFISIEPKERIKFELPGSADLYYELPIRIQLKCGFFELVGFIKKIEDAKRLMKVTSLSIKSNPQNEWDHDVEVVISNFARGNPKGEEGE
jgi:Tfp pilus assembly protein PilO